MEDMRDNLPQADGENNVNPANPKEETSPISPKQDNSETSEQESSIEAKEIVSEEVKVSEETAVVEETKAEAPETAEAEEVEKSAANAEEEDWIDDDTAEVFSDDESEDDFAKEELVMPDYSQFPPEALVKEAERLMQNEPAHTIKDHFEEIRKYLLRHLDEERKERLDAFVAEGNAAMDFQFEQTLRKRFRELFNLYRDQRRKYYQELQERLENNLSKKEALIEQLKELVNKSETIGDTFKEFNAIQATWREIGPVPRTDSATLYRNYHHHVENFYGYIKLNKELRAMDFKKNHDAKVALIAEAQAIEKEDFKPDVFKKLQALHGKWKNIGPVEPEHREPLWEQFSTATKSLHDKREAYYALLQEQKEETIAKKRALVEKLKEVPANHQKHGQWQTAMKSINEIAEEYKALGRVQHADNDVVWEEFKAALRDFNHAKNEFYKELKKVHKENLDQKKALLAKAEELKDSTDWKETTQAFKKLQADWKKVGHVPKAESEKVWKAFHEACNHYFGRLTDQNNARDKALEANLEAKKAILDELQAVTGGENPKETIKQIKALIKKWKEAGPLPRGKGNLEKKFSSLLDEKFEAAKMDRKESRRIQFETKMDDLNQQGGDDKLKKETDFLKRKLDEAKMELNQLETNLSFFSSTKSNNPLLLEAQKNIDRKQGEIDDLKERIKMLNIKRRELKEAREKEAEPESAGDENTTAE